MRSRFITLIALLLLSKSIGLALAQTGRITGTVIDARSGQPLSDVNVTVADSNIGAATSNEGEFIIEKVPAGDHLLVARRIGYQAIEREITIESGQTLKLDLPLTIKPLEFEEVVVERTSLVGNKERLFNIPGSAHYLDAKDLRQFEYQDVHRVLREIPGVNIQEEEGYGLRPNIGFRGTGVERSAKIAVMEDGILQAPAPYSAPAAYYFPTIGRMNGNEVRKGSSQIKYGPFTTGGAINFISTPIPSDFSGYVKLSAGEDRHRTIHATAGNSFRNVGFLVETFQENTDGFKQLDGGGNTGFDKEDYLVKLRINTNPTARVYQQLSFKFAQTDETSDETYLGLTDLDFQRDPIRRYAGSQEDVMNTDHTQFLARHFIKPSGALDVTTSFYHTEFSRNWYKLDFVRASADGPAVGIASLLEDPETHSAEYQIVTGATSPNDNALGVKANNRSYYATGVQSQLVLGFNAGQQKQELELGIRYHEDEIDRFQWVDDYRMVDGVMELTNPGTPGTESNRIERATVWAGYAELDLHFGKLTVVPGLRYENMELTRDDFGRADPERTGAALNSRKNREDALIPGIGVDYKITPFISSFVGIHKGFAPPGSRAGTRPESSLNYEAGFRMNKPWFNFTGVLFFNDYSNLLGVDLNAVGGGGTGDQFNGGQVDVFGLELSSNYDLGVAFRTRTFAIPVRVAYTFTQTEFKNSFESEYEPWGTVQIGDELPYVPEHQLFASAGLEWQRFSLGLSAKYMSQMRTVAGQGPLLDAQSTDAYLVFDASFSVAVTPGSSVFATVRNLTDETYIVARRPAGVRPGLPRKFQLGIRTEF